MSDYKTDQDWLMRELEDKQREIERGDLEDIVAGIDSTLRRTIVRVMRVARPELSHVHASECFARWKAGYLAQIPGAIRLLDTARQLRTDDFGGL